MGNCLVIGDKVIKVVKPDGKILEYRSPIKAIDIVSEFSGHRVSETQASPQFLRPEAKLRGGNMYYLMPIKTREGGSLKSKKKVRFSEPKKEYLSDREEKKEKASSSKVVRIKVVISKQELVEMLRKEGVSVNDMVSKLQAIGGEKQILSESCDNNDHNCHDDHDGNREEAYWKPVLDSIAEV